MSTQKFVRFLLLLAVAAVAALMIAGALQPRSVTATRSIIINAPKDSVFNQMVHFKNWPNWSPWSRMDTSMKNEFTGNDGQPGSVYHWIGDARKTGEAEIMTTKVTGTEMEFSFKLIKPEAPGTTGALSAIDTAGGTKATISFTNHFDYPWNAIIIFNNYDKLMGKDLDNALANLKQVAEKK